MSPHNTPSRISTLPTTIFTTMSRLAVEHGAVNLGQGYPDFNGPDWIIDEALAAMRAGKNQYAPMAGTLSLRRAIAAYQKRYYGLDWDVEEEITVTAGATEALFSALLAVVGEGDEVILFEPFYDSHQANVLIAGGVPRYVTLQRPDFRIDAEALERTVTSRTRCIVVNTPHNPTGRVFERAELEAVADVARRRDLLVLSDEVYEFLTFDGEEHIPFASLPGMRERTIAVSSTGKTFGMTGWKVGFAMARPALTEAVRKMHQFVTFAVNTPGQHAMAHALGRLESYLPEFRRDYLARRDAMLAGLRDTVFAPHVPRGTYFMMVDIPPALGMNDVECTMTLLKEYGVATIPPSAFYASSGEGAGLLRLCFAKKAETLAAGLERLAHVKIPR